MEKKKSTIFIEQINLLASHYTYTTINDKTISLPDISYIDAITNAEDECKKYNIMQHNGNVITVVHPDEQLLKKDKRKLELAWERFLQYKK